MTPLLTRSFHVKKEWVAHATAAMSWQKQRILHSISPYIAHQMMIKNMRHTMYNWLHSTHRTWD